MGWVEVARRAGDREWEEEREKVSSVWRDRGAVTYLLKVCLDFPGVEFTCYFGKEVSIYDCDVVHFAQC